MRVDAPAASTTALTINMSVGHPSVRDSAGLRDVESDFLSDHLCDARVASPRAALPRQEVGDVIPAAFDYLRAHSDDEALAHLQQHGAEARVLAGGQSLIPAMRFRLARPAVLVDINALNDLNYVRVDAIGAGRSARSRATATSSARRGSATGAGACIHDVSRVVADPVVRQMGTVVGSLCHNDPAGDWTTVALASRAKVVVRGKGGTRRVADRRFLVDSFTTAVGEGEMALGASSSRCRTIAPPGSYQKVERKVGDFATAAAAVQVSLNADGTIRAAGVALSAAGPCAVRVDEAERLLDGQKPTADLIRAAADAASRAARRRPTCAAASNTRSIWPACSSARGLRQALARLGVQA